MGWWMVFGGILMLLFWGGVIALIVWGIRSLTGRKDAGGGEKQSPLEIAKERYARGEISKEQYDQIRKDLM
jgi:putative membrane protein